MALLSRNLHLVKAEEESILRSATVSPYDPIYTYYDTPDLDVVLNGSFKSFV